MSTTPSPSIGVAIPRAPSVHRTRSFHKDFYFIMAIVIAAVVVYGFSHTVDKSLIHASPIPPSILWLHAAVFCGWVLFFILQTALVRTRNVKIHRTIGWFGVAMGCLIPILGITTAVMMDRFRSNVLHQADAARFAVVPVQRYAVLHRHFLSGRVLAQKAGLPPPPDVRSYLRDDLGSLRPYPDDQSRPSLLRGR